ncbi:MAG: flagellar hook-associated protein FlgK [Gemmatimonadota bacterium]
MATLGNILNNARQAIISHRVAMQTVSHNIANAETRGYTRQRAELSALQPVAFPWGSVGSGVGIADIVRMRDTLLDDAFRRDSGTRDGFDVRRQLLSEVESILNEPGSTGLASALDEFWNSWSDLANNPGNGSVQSVVRQRGEHVARLLNAHATRVADLAQRARQRLGANVTTVNELARQVAELNRQITSAESGGNQAPDLRDQLDRISDRLASLAGARSVVQANGTMGIYIGTSMIVDATNARVLEVRGLAPVSLGIKGDPDALLGVGGQQQSLVDFVNIDVSAATGRIDAIARGLVNGVNELHAGGWTAAGDALGNANWNPLLGPTGSRVSFFDASFVTAGTIRISSAVGADHRVIAAGDVQNAPGNTSVALALGALRDDVGMAALAARMGASFATLIGFAAGESYADHYTQTVSDVAVAVDHNTSQFAIYDTLTTRADNQRLSVSGVSIDEELTLMLQHQQAFTAASRVVRAADEMAQTLLDMV